MKVYDNVLDKSFLDVIIRSIFRLKWEIHSSNENQKTPLFFNSTTLGGNVRVEEYDYLFNIVSSIVVKDPETNIKNLDLTRGYVNLYPYGIGGDWHTDDSVWPSKSVTLLFYPTDWKKKYGGATEFQDTAEKVEYKKNRLLVFDGNIHHRGAIHQNPKNRYTIAFKTTSHETL